MLKKETPIEQHYIELREKSKKLELVSKAPSQVKNIPLHIECVRQKIFEIQNMTFSDMTALFVHKSEIISAWDSVRRARKKVHKFYEIKK